MSHPRSLIVDSQRENVRVAASFTVGPHPEETGEPTTTEHASTFIVTDQAPAIHVLGPYFSWPYTQDGHVDEDIKDGRCFLRLAALFRGLGPDTLVRGAFYLWKNFVGEGNQDSQGRPLPTDDPFEPTVFDPRRAGYTDAYGPLRFTDDIQSMKRAAGNGPAENAWFLLDESNRDNPRDLFARDDATFAPMTYRSVDTATGILHSKFVLFDELEFPAGADVPANFPSTMSHVVVVTSGNPEDMTIADNLLILYGNAELYEFFLAYWERRRTEGIGKGDARTFVPDSLDVPMVFTYPREASDNPVVDELAEVLREMSPEAPAVIRIAMYRFKGLDVIRDCLVDLAEAGADIRVVLYNAAFNGSKAGDLMDASVDVRAMPPERGAGGSSGGSSSGARLMHHKFMLIEAHRTLGGERRRRQQVWTGSYNWTDPAQTESDEISVVFRDQGGVYADYLQAFDRLFGAGIPWPD